MSLQKRSHFNRSTLSSEGANLESWLRANKLGSLLPQLTNNGITEISDLEALETPSDVDELANELGIKVIPRKKFKRAVLDLIRWKPELETDELKQPGHVVQSTESRRNRLNQPMSRKNKNRMPFRGIRPGINVVPFIRNEYKVPNLKRKDFMSFGGSGFVNQLISVLTMASQSVFNNQDMKGKKRDVIVNERSITDPERLFADKNHKIILVCGKTGAGKSTLINSMMNYIYGVQMSDNFRLKLIEE
eukprot:994970_1